MTKNAFVEIVTLKLLFLGEKGAEISLKKEKKKTHLLKSKILKKYFQKRRLRVCNFYLENGELASFLERFFLILFQRNQSFQSINSILREIFESFPKIKSLKNLEKILNSLQKLTSRNFQNCQVSEELVVLGNSLSESKGIPFSNDYHVRKTKVFEAYRGKNELYLELLRMRLDGSDFSGGGIFANKFFQKGRFGKLFFRQKLCVVDQMIRVFSFHKKINEMVKLFFCRMEIIYFIDSGFLENHRGIVAFLFLFIHSPIKNPKKWLSILFLLKIWETWDPVLAKSIISSICNFQKDWSYFKNLLIQNIPKGFVFSPVSFRNLLRSSRAFFIRRNLKILSRYFKVVKLKKISSWFQLDSRDLEHWIFDIFCLQGKVQIDFLKNKIRFF